MFKNFSLYGLLFLIFSCETANSQQTTNTEVSKIVVIEIYKAISTGNDVTRGDTVSIRIEHFNTSGKLIYEYNEIPPINHSLAVNYIYDSLQQLTKSRYTTTNRGKERGFEVVYTHNASGQVEKEEFFKFNQPDNPYEWGHHRFDDSGKKRETLEASNYNIEPDTRHEYHYYPDGKMELEMLYDQFNNLGSYIEYGYDDKGNVAKKCTFDSRGELEKCDYRTYDNYNRLLTQGETHRQLKAGELPIRHNYYSYTDIDDSGDWGIKIKYLANSAGDKRPLEIWFRTETDKLD
ncbi:hypothetical protein [Lewinella sp. LCG006]|uniref:hypothetical protein n=1 Tax=Lewinella sp. LCG006 TaxID=3231911 RepID=UPI003460A2CB